MVLPSRNIQFNRKRGDSSHPWSLAPFCLVLIPSLCIPLHQSLMLGLGLSLSLHHTRYHRGPGLPKVNSEDACGLVGAPRAP